MGFVETLSGKGKWEHTTDLSKELANSVPLRLFAPGRFEAPKKDFIDVTSPVVLTDIWKCQASSAFGS